MQPAGAWPTDEAARTKCAALNHVQGEDEALLAERQRAAEGSANVRHQERCPAVHMVMLSVSADPENIGPLRRAFSRGQKHTRVVAG